MILSGNPDGRRLPDPQEPPYATTQTYRLSRHGEVPGMISTGQIIGAFQSHFSTASIDVLTPGLAGLTDGVAEIGTQLTALLNGQPTTEDVIWLLDDMVLPGATGPNLATPVADGSTIGVEILGRQSVSSFIRYPVPQLNGSLPDQTLDENTGTQQIDGSAVFNFAGTLGFTLIGAPTGVSVAGSSGLISINTAQTDPQNATPITLRGFDQGDPERFAETSFTLSIAGASTAPAAFGASDWTVNDAQTGGDAFVTLLALPDNGGAFIQVVQYRLNGGGWAPIPGSNATGVYSLLDVFTDGVPTTVQLRAVNSNGGGAVSDVKTVTTSDASSTPTVWSFAGSTVTALPSSAGWSFAGSTVIAIGDV